MKYAFMGLEHNGKSTSMLYGFAKNFPIIVRNYKISNVIVCWDYGHSSVRKNIYPDYKKNRIKDSDEYKEYLEQLGELFDFIKLFPFKQIKIKGVEADDLIKIVSESYKNSKILIYSSDRDFFQLLSDNISVINKETLITKENFEKDRFPISKYLIYKSILGDPSDYVPGVSGLGEVKTKKILSLINQPDDFIKLKSHTTFGKYITEDSIKIFERNMKILGLGKEFLSEEQHNEVTEQLSSSVPIFQPNKVKGIYQRKKFVSLLADPDFITPFFKLKRNKD
jgi:5'-3' exonuclease